MDAQAAGGLAEYGHAPAISSKAGDVVLHPAQRGLLVHEAVVPRGVVGRLRAQRRMREEPEHAEPVVQGDDHDALVHEPDGIVVVALSDEERAAVDPHHHRKPLVSVLVTVAVVPTALIVAAGGSEHVEEQAIFAGAGKTEGRCALRTMVAKPRRVAHAGPAPVRLRRLPAQVADRRCRIGNAEEPVDAARERTADGALSRRHHWRSLLRAGCRSREHDRGEREIAGQTR